ncbi:glycoside hydrolase family 25 protein [Amanita thiersii Skay4041]|uniref:N,O-diacetylmuramidase n=1 Tax=Amanita thiersii Skay4041 TaxID=703135 RepID=A0A2A9NJU5_9AGAR|nr:glycoside hydrolase family 25 protein [Amanita thiersii Skay4041]
MKLLTALTVALTTALPALAGPVFLDKRANPLGIDVSGFQPNVDFNAVKANGISFVYIKATEGTTFISSSFSNQYIGATNAGLIRGAYHFAHPDSSSGATQANFFLAHGGGWSGDGITLPGVLDIEYNPNGAECYGLSASAMVSWVQDFSNTYVANTGRFPDWWTTCTGNSGAFGTNNPLWIAHYASTIGTIPAGFPFATFWQYADSGPNPGDQDLFNGDDAGLARFARGG